MLLKVTHVSQCTYAYWAVITWFSTMLEGLTSALIGLVLVIGSAVGVLLLLLATRADLTGDLAISVEPTGVLTTVVGVGALALIGGAAAVIRVLRIEPIRATQGNSRSL